MSTKHLGASFDEFLEEEGILEEIEAAAIERIIARRTEGAVTEQPPSRAEPTA